MLEFQAVYEKRGVIFFRTTIRAAAISQQSECIFLIITFPEFQSCLVQLRCEPLNSIAASGEGLVYGQLHRGD